MLVEIEYCINSFGRVNHASMVLRFANLLFKLIENGFMAVEQDEKNNIFPISLALVEGETAGGYSFFLKISKHTLLYNPISILFYTYMHLLRVHKIIHITDGKIIFLPMSPALYILHKTSCGKSKIRTF